MPCEIDETHDPKLESWVESANDPATDFPIQNLPLCACHPEEDDFEPTVGVRIGDRILSLYQASRVLTFYGYRPYRDPYGTDAGDPMLSHQSGGMSGMPYGRSAHFNRAIRRELQRGLSIDAPAEIRKELEKALYDPEVFLPLPMIGTDYTDFYASVFHATNVGSMFRPDNPLLPNYKHIPIAYHGRASSIVPSGTEIVRPSGQMAPAEEGGSPGFGPCKMLDYELEVGLIVGRGNELGTPIPITEAEDHILGMCLVNDWSARDMQKWEYQPLGPFLAKSFATTVSPYIVTMEALAPFRTPAYERPAGDPQPLPYLTSEANTSAGGVDLTLEVYLQSAQMRSKSMDPIRLSRGSFKDMYWTIAQMLTHHASNGCNLQPGDLMASGTVSGPTREARGCLLELTWDGDPFANPPKVVPGTQRTPIELPTGETRKFLEDGDEVIIKGYCEREGFRRIGFGECWGAVSPAR
jgi:fumarylacetoacetase